MKNTTYSRIMIALSALLLLGSCKDFLEKEPLAVETTAVFYKNEQNLVQAVNEAYHSLQSIVNLYQVNHIVFGDLPSDDGSFDKGNPFFRAAGNFTLSTATGEINGLWTTNYTIITKSNLILANTTEGTSELVNRSRGEAHFLRALAYFNLQRSFGGEKGLPLFTEPVLPEKLFQARTPGVQIWAQIEEDLRNAARLLPLRHPSSDVGRATKGSANALLSKTYVYQQKWSQAADAAAQVINSNTYDLVPIEQFLSGFHTAGDNNIESVFEVQYHERGWSYDGEFSALPRYTAPAAWPYYGQGLGLYVFNQDFVNSFEKGDGRFKATVYTVGDTVQGVPYNTKWSTISAYHPKKYLASKTELKDGNDPWSSLINVKVIRFAEVLLFHAEALNEAGRPAEALQSLNRVRRRARGKSPATVLPDITTTDQTALRNIVRNERRVELGAEGHRFFDLVRWGIAAEKVGSKGFIKGKHELLPIPQIELDLNSALEQNPGY